jgi:hypothetical protein
MNCSSSTLKLLKKLDDSRTKIFADICCSPNPRLDDDFLLIFQFPKKISVQDSIVESFRILNE